jgi:hypothetical protein
MPPAQTIQMRPTWHRRCQGYNRPCPANHIVCGAKSFKPRARHTVVPLTCRGSVRESARADTDSAENPRYEFLNKTQLRAPVTTTRPNETKSPTMPLTRASQRRSRTDPRVLAPTHGVTTTVGKYDCEEKKHRLQIFSFETACCRCCGELLTCLFNSVVCSLHAFLSLQS